MDNRIIGDSEGFLSGLIETTQQIPTKKMDFLGTFWVLLEH